jgi:hypothetical protein
VNDLKWFSGAALGAFVIALVVAPAGATAAQHWQHLWDDAHQGDVDFFVANDDPAPFNTSTADSEMGNGRLTWNNVSGAPNLTDYGGTTSMSGIACGSSSGPPNGRAFMKGCALSSYAAFTWAAVVSYDGGAHWYTYRAVIGIDTTPSGFTWHISSSSTVPAGKKDLRSAAAHELGHVNGAQDINVNCSSTTGAQTMCSPHQTASSQYRSAAAHETADWKERDTLQ